MVSILFSDLFDTVSRTLNMNAIIVIIHLETSNEHFKKKYEYC